MSDSTGLKALWAGSKSAEAQLLKSTQENSANQAGAQQSVSADISQLLPEKLASFKTLLNANQTNTPATAGSAQVVDTVAATSPVASAASALDVLSRPLDSMSPAARTFAVQTSVAQTVGQPGWSQAVGDRVLWLAAQNLSAAEIRLDPPDLGSMHVKVAVHDNQASVSFVSPHPVVREALDQQANRLREMFSEQGLNLVNVDVSERQQNPNSQEQGQGNGQAGTKAEDETVQVVASTPVASLRLVDHYA